MSEALVNPIGPCAQCGKALLTTLSENEAKAGFVFRRKMSSDDPRAVEAICPACAGSEGVVIKR